MQESHRPGKDACESSWLLSMQLKSVNIFTENQLYAKYQDMVPKLKYMQEITHKPLQNEIS